MQYAAYGKKEMQTTVLFAIEDSIFLRIEVKNVDFTSLLFLYWYAIIEKIERKAGE